MSPWGKPLRGGHRAIASKLFGCVSNGLGGRPFHLLLPDRQIRQPNNLNTTGFAVLGLDLAIQAEQTVAAESPFRRHLTPNL